MSNSGGRDAADAGFSLVELLVAMGIALAILGVAFTVLSGWQLAFGAENERADQQQRLRVAVERLVERSDVGRRRCPSRQRGRPARALRRLGISVSSGRPDS